MAVGHNRGKIKSLGINWQDQGNEVFWMSLEEAKRAISEDPDYEHLAERHERRVPKHKLA